MNKKGKVFASLFIILSFGVFVSKLTSNVSLDNIKNTITLIKQKVNKEKVNEDIISKDITTIINGTTTSIDIEGDGVDASATIIYDASDFALMNGSSGSFKLANDITIPDSMISLGIETFDGNFNGDGYTIYNLNGSFVNTLTGTICNVIIDSPRQFSATLDEGNITRPVLSNTLYGLVTGTTYSLTSPQYFGYVSGKVNGGTIDNVKVSNATIDTNGSTEGILSSSIKTTGYMGFIAGQATSNSYIINSSVTDSTLIHSSSYAVGGIVGYTSGSNIKGCLVNDLTITGKDDIAINTMPKAFTGLLVGALKQSQLSDSIVADISQTTASYLSYVGAALYTPNSDVVRINNIYYDDSVAHFSTTGSQDGYERLYKIEGDPINSANASVDEFGHVYDIDRSSLGYNRTLIIKDIHPYTTQSLSTMISDYNSTLASYGMLLKRNTSTYDINNYVADEDKVVAFDYSISDDITFGDYLKDKVTLSLDTSKTNFDTDVFLQYKFEGTSYFTKMTDTTIVTAMSGEWQICYLDKGISKVIENATGTFNIKPFDLNDAIFSISSHQYSGYENNVMISAETPSGIRLNTTISGTSKATEVGVYDVVVTGSDSCSVGSVNKQWEITIGNMIVSASNVNTTYDSTYHSIEVKAPNNTTITYSVDGINYTSTNPSYKDAGTYTVYYKASNPNYNEVKGSAIITINPQILKVTWGETSLVYNGQEQIPEVTLGNIKGDDVVNITEFSGYAIEEGDKYTAKILGIDNDNYKLPSEISTSFEITPILIEVPEISEKAYTGEMLYADVNEDDGYTIDGIYYGIYVGEYDFTLKPKANHAWKNGSKVKLSYTFIITKGENAWLIFPSIENWTYGEQPSELIYQSKFGNPSITYYKEGEDEKLSGIPTEAGNYEVTLYVSISNNFMNTLDKTLKFTIEKANPSYELPTNLTISYGKTLNDVVLPSDENGTYSFKEDGSTLLNEVREYTFTLVYTPNDTNNYNVIEKQVSISVTKADVTYVAPTTISNLTYNGSQQVLIDAGSTNDGTFEYKVDDGEYSTNLPSKTDAKTYTIYYRIIGDENHNDVTPQSLIVSIAPLKVNIVDVTINDVHIDKNGYEFIASNIIFDNELTTNDYEISSITLTSNNEVGTQNVDVVINIKNANYELVSNTYSTNVIINDHESNMDDDDCTTSVTCKYCEHIFIQANDNHEAQEDDGNCITDVFCKHCSQIVIEAKDAHEEEIDDNDCSTAITCKHCEVILFEAKTHSLSSTYTKTKDGHYQNCRNDNCAYVTDIENHISSGQASENTPEICTICEYIITPALNHTTHEKKGDLMYDDTYHWYKCVGCEQQIEKENHLYDTHTKIDENTHNSICICGKESINNHIYGDWVIDKEPTENEKGSKIKTCACGHTITEEISPIDSHYPPEEIEKKLPTGAIIAIVIGSISLLGIALLSLYWFVIKKRSFKDLFKR